MEDNGEKRRERGITRFSREAERTFFFYATMAMFVFFACMRLFGD